MSKLAPDGNQSLLKDSEQYYLGGIAAGHQIVEPFLLHGKFANEHRGGIFKQRDIAQQIVASIAEKLRGDPFMLCPSPVLAVFPSGGKRIQPFSGADSLTNQLNQEAAKASLWSTFLRETTWP